MTVAMAGCGGRVSYGYSSTGSSMPSGSSDGGAGADGGVGVGAVPNPVVKKVDLLFDIDNSPAMGDKQPYLVQAIQDLVYGLVNPNCVDSSTLALVAKSVGGLGGPAGSQPEFPAVTDMHIGLVSSSLGPRLSEMDPTGATGVCYDPQQAKGPYGGINAHMDDKAHLLARSLTGAAPNLLEGSVADAASGFLYWYPTSNGMGENGPPVGTATPLDSSATLQMDFTSLVAGVGVFGCEIPSQMESWIGSWYSPILTPRSASVRPIP
jgi:hypothetical protein